MRALVGATLVLLAGCATQTQQTARTDSIDDLLDSPRSTLVARSDPLGAWLETDPPLGIERMDAARGQPGLTPAPHTMAGTALKFLGVKYRYGGNGPNKGFDCSGLVAYAAEKSLGLKLPRIASQQARLGTSVKRDELRRGDLVFFNTLGRRFSHVGIYLGDQKFVHAPRSGAEIRVESMDMAYWRKRYNGARRLQASSAQAGSATASR
ncbi:C40 family peptidase [Castellaniella sp.]|uniref:C40 family peptidase n=1 Tax=Castellaniella sp. TaxID=1955812 RepID=UPI003562FBBB